VVNIFPGQSDPHERKHQNACGAEVLAKAHAYCSASAAEDIQAVNVLGANDSSPHLLAGSRQL